MLFNLKRGDAIYPYQNRQLHFMARKWGVDPNDLKEAMLQTGSLKKKVIKEYLEKKGIIFSFSGLMLKMKNGLKRVRDKFNEEEYYC